MTFLDVVFVALIQGIGETLPLGGAGHLALLPGLAADPHGRAAVLAAADLGIALALMLYFWRDMAIFGRAVVKLFKGRIEPGAVLLFKILGGALPALAIMWALGGVPAETGRLGAAVVLTVFGLLLLIADKLGVTVRRIEHLGWVGALVIGLLQLASMVPGVSRTGITITAARLMGFERRDAARFSLLLGIPLLLGQAGLNIMALSGTSTLVISTDLLAALGLAFVAAWLAVVILMAWLSRHTYSLFALWRVLLGLSVLGLTGAAGLLL